MIDQIEVFRDMSIRCPVDKRNDLRSALIDAAMKPWSTDLEGTARVALDEQISKDLVLFLTEAGSDYPASSLTLCETADGYHVPNIVPIDSAELSHHQYNAILDDFIVKVAKPVVKKFEFEISVTKAIQSINDWVSDEAAFKLRRFSNEANKWCEINRRDDRQRWFDFIVAARRSNNRPDADNLFRWLHESQGWSEDVAYKLAGDFAGSLELLKYYDEH